MRTETGAGLRAAPSASHGTSISTLGIDIGATRTRLAIVTDGVIGERSVRATAELAGPGRDVIVDLVAEARALGHAAAGSPVRAVGVSVAAFVDGTGVILERREGGIPTGARLRDDLAAALQVPVAVENDANLAALAELHLGAARGHVNVALVTLGTNIGLGLIVGGAVHRGAHGAAGEAGLLLVPATPVAQGGALRFIVDAGPLGRAASTAPRGYAWIEELVGGGALAAAADELGWVPPSDDRRPLTAQALEDPTLRPLADRAVEGWALLIAELTVLLDPELVVLTGGLAADAAHLLGRVRRRVGELTPFAPLIRLGRLGPDAELLGADLLARSLIDSLVVHDARAGLSAQREEDLDGDKA